MGNNYIGSTNPAFLNATDALSKALSNVETSKFTQAEAYMIYSMSSKVSRAVLESVPYDMLGDSDNNE
ncbi:hypothetical protein HOS79_gp062 [Lactobacillus phage Nyseid]|uniref:Uncharacterized protein n=1 Tax=Lactobacillus phage Nyseid TaxID=2079432 RepID=A0A2K9VC76_9CAUD|nr:hypothetical protein HOS79_gp062 [Lactobacillus phage Nyseid]AUV59822.1 hypothetical protein [Lactobacillus phage Nyseid]